MKVGVAFPTTEIGSDPVVIRDFVQAVEGMGYDYLTLIDHVIHPAKGPGTYRDFYSRDNMFHETFVLFGFVAAATKRLGLVSAVLIMPQRQTVLVAKQAAEIDLLSGGRLRLGLGIGWSEMEYAALNENFRDRGRRVEEQIEVMRRLWTEELVTYKGNWHTIEDAGLNPLPVQRPIPVWLGGAAEPAIRRAGRIADGFIVTPRSTDLSVIRATIETFRTSAAEAGRDAAALGVDATVLLADRGVQELASEAEELRGFGADHVTLRTMYSGLETIDDHLQVMRRFRETWRPA